MTTQEFLSNYTDRLEKQFPPDFQITYELKRDAIVISRVVTSLNREIECLEFVLKEPHTIIIKSILGCASHADDMGHGKDIVRRLVRFVKSLPKHHDLVVEFDVSRITIHGHVFPLYAMKILSTGKSWYNSLGFYEDQYMKNSKCIEEFLSEPQPRTGKPPQTVQQYFTTVVNKLLELSRKNIQELTEDERKYIHEMHTKIKNKYATLETKCFLTAHNKLSDLMYRDAPVVGGKRKTRKNV